MFLSFKETCFISNLKNNNETSIFVKLSSFLLSFQSMTVTFLRFSCKVQLYLFQCSILFSASGDVGIGLVDERSHDVHAESVDNEDGTFTINYTPTSVGEYTVSVFYNETEVPHSPFRVPVKSDIDVSKVRVENLDPSK